MHQVFWFTCNFCSYVHTVCEVVECCTLLSSNGNHWRNDHALAGTLQDLSLQCISLAQASLDVDVVADIATAVS